MASGDTKTEAMLNALGNGGSADEFRGCCNTKTQQYILDAIDRVQNVEDEVEELKNNPDVVDIVDTYADLQAYDTQHLSNNDIIRVLADETHSGNSTYYKFNKQAGTWTFIGEISGGSITPVQTTGSSTTDVMSQKATTSMVFADPSTQQRVRIGSGAMTGNYSESVAIGKNAQANGSECVAIGSGAGYGTTAGGGSQLVAVGKNAGQNMSSATGTVSLGAYSKATRIGEVNVGSTVTSYGYNSTNYRVIGGVHDPVDAHDAATKGYVDANAGGSVVYYVKSTELVDGQTVHLYKDSSFTTVATILEVWTAAYNCKDIKIVYKGLTENDFSFRETYNVFKTNYPVTCTNDSMDEDGFALYLNGIVSPYDKRVITLQTFSGPEDDNFSCVIATI